MKRGTPPTVVEAARDRQVERILYRLILASWAAYVTAILAAWYWHFPALMVVAGAGIVLQGVPFWLLKRGHVQASNIVLMAGVLGIVTVIASIGQGFRDAAVVAFPVIFVFAGLTLNRRLFGLSVLFTLAAVGWLYFGETLGWYVPQPFGGPPSWPDLLVTAVILLVSAFSVDLLATNMRRNLLEARHEIEQRKKAEEDNRRLREKVEISNRLAAVGQMAAGIAHEINNPLTSVLGFSQLLSQRQDLPDDVKEELKVIENGSKRASEIIKRLLTFAGQSKPVKTPAGINELIEATLEMRGYVLRTANIEVVRRLAPDLPLVLADKAQLQQVFINIIINAEFSMKQAHGRGTLGITSEKLDGHIRVSFRDDGTGISPETKEKLFNPFFTTKEVGQGTGLGLSLSRSIILEHGGTLDVESEPGKGANFIITLPIAASGERPAEPATCASASREKARSAFILVVDDEDDIRKLISRVLSRDGHTVETTGDVRAALSKIESVDYDAILADIRMPGMSGMEFYRNVALKRPELAGKFIFITGDVSDPNTQDFLEQNKLFYIAKPFSREILTQCVAAVL